MAAKVLERCCHPAKVRVWMEIERRRLVVHVFALVAINRDSQPIVSIVSDAYCGFHKPSNTSVSFSVPFAMSFNAINGGQRQLVVLVLILTIFPLVLLQVAALQIVCCVNSDYIWRLLVFMCALSYSHFIANVIWFDLVPKPNNAIDSFFDTRPHIINANERS